LARPKAFNQDQVLTEAMLCFWHRGYGATSLKELQAATGLTPGSIYNSFDSKDGLFLASLDHYIDEVVAHRVREHLLKGDPIAGIEAYIFECFRNRDNGEEIQQGCLLINTSTELGPHDEVVRAHVVKGMKVAQRGLQSAIERAQSTGQIKAEADAKVLARHLGLLLNGMLVQAKISSGQGWLDSAMGNIRSLLH